MKYFPAPNAIRIRVSSILRCLKVTYIVDTLLNYFPVVLFNCPYTAPNIIRIPNLYPDFFFEGTPSFYHEPCIVKKKVSDATLGSQMRKIRLKYV